MSSIALQSISSNGLNIVGQGYKTAYGLWYLSATPTANTTIPKSCWTQHASTPNQTLQLSTAGNISTTVGGIWAITLNITNSGNGSANALSTGIVVGPSASSVIYWQATNTTLGSTNSCNTVIMYIPANTSIGATLNFTTAPPTGVGQILSIALVCPC